MSTAEKMLPQNVEAEIGVLGSLLIDPAALVEVTDVLRPEDFYREAHRLVYQAALDLYESGTPADLITLTDELARRGKLDEIGGVSFVSSLANDVPTSKSAKQYAQIVARTAVSRRVIHQCGQIAALAYNDPDAEQVVQIGINEFLRLAERGQTTRRKTRMLRDVLDDLAEETLAAMEHEEYAGLRTGFAEIDRHILGFRPGKLYYLAGRPSSGKSALGLKLALQAALACHAQQRGTVDVVTLEMPDVELAGRVVGDYASLNTIFIGAGFREQAKSDPDMDAWARFDEHRVWLADRIGDRVAVTDGVVSVAELRMLAMRAKMERDCRLLVVDQLDLMADGGEEYERMTKMSRALKQIARSVGIAVLCMVQIGRKVEDRHNKRPTMADLKGSGQLEQDADVILGLHRQAQWDTERAAKVGEAQFAQFAELAILKNRGGPRGVWVPLWFQAEYTRFREWPFPSYPSDSTRGEQSNEE